MSAAIVVGPVAVAVTEFPIVETTTFEFPSCF